MTECQKCLDRERDEDRKAEERYWRRKERHEEGRLDAWRCFRFVFFFIVALLAFATAIVFVVLGGGWWAVLFFGLSVIANLGWSSALNS